MYFTAPHYHTHIDTKHMNSHTKWVQQDNKEPQKRLRFAPKGVWVPGFLEIIGFHSF